MKGRREGIADRKPAPLITGFVQRVGERQGKYAEIKWCNVTKKENETEGEEHVERGKKSEGELLMCNKKRTRSSNDINSREESL